MRLLYSLRSAQPVECTITFSNARSSRTIDIVATPKNSDGFVEVNGVRVGATTARVRIPSLISVDIEATNVYVETLSKNVTFKINVKNEVDKKLPSRTVLLMNAVGSSRPPTAA